MEEQLNEGIVEKSEKAIERVAETLNINLPREQLSLEMKIVALLFLTGAFGLIGSIFGSFFGGEVNGTNILSKLIGTVWFIAIAYAVIKQNRLALWLTGLLVVIAAIQSLILAVIPLVLAVYLFIKRDVLKPSILDFYLGEVGRFLKNLRQEKGQ